MHPLERRRSADTDELTGDDEPIQEGQINKRDCSVPVSLVHDASHAHAGAAVQKNPRDGQLIESTSSGAENPR
jgi:hypothetical protein